LAKVNVVTGALDTVFTGATGTNRFVTSIALSGSNVVAGGDFSTYRGTAIRHLAKFDKATDVFDTAFSLNASPNDHVSALLLNGTSLYVGGNFSDVSGQVAPRLAKLDSRSGAIDVPFTQSAGVGGNVATLLWHNGALYVGGLISSYRGVPRTGILKLDPTTANPDPAFTPILAGTGSVAALASDAAGLFYVGGLFTTWNGQPANYLAKINPATGVLDTTFTQATGIDNISRGVQTLAFAGGALYVGGSFQTYRGVSVGNIMKVDPQNGALDNTFSAGGGVGGEVMSIVPAGTNVYFTGNFGTYRLVRADNLVKADASNGAADSLFTVSPGVCDGYFVAFECGGITNFVVRDGARLYVGAYSGSTYRTAPAYFFYPIDAITGDLLDP
jgi:hypothetical protein